MLPALQMRTADAEIAGVRMRCGHSEEMDMPAFKNSYSTDVPPAPNSVAGSHTP